MKASVLDLRKKMSDIIKALDQNETVTLFYRGKEKGIIYPMVNKKENPMPVTDHPAFGMWKDRKDLEDVEGIIRSLRKGRYNVI